MTAPSKIASLTKFRALCRDVEREVEKYGYADPLTADALTRTVRALSSTLPEGTLR